MAVRPSVPLEVHAVAGLDWNVLVTRLCTLVARDVPTPVSIWLHEAVVLVIGHPAGLLWEVVWGVEPVGRGTSILLATSGMEAIADRAAVAMVNRPLSG
ncbi:hypothetical protein KC367_g193 [Hortaea werneckii]|nr:hypothetical protein KC367_g193 [Hortaea werneckii]